MIPETNFAEIQEIEDAISAQTMEMWMRSRLIFYTIFATTAAKFLNIHNELKIIMGCLLSLSLFYYLRTAVQPRHYPSVDSLVYQIADMLVALFQIFAATSLGDSATSFLTVGGMLNIRSVNKIFILIMMIFVAMLVLPKHFRLPIAKKS